MKMNVSKPESKELVEDEPLINEADGSKYEENHHCPVPKKLKEQQDNISI